MSVARGAPYLCPPYGGGCTASAGRSLGTERRPSPPRTREDLPAAAPGDACPPRGRRCLQRRAELWTGETPATKAAGDTLPRTGKALGGSVWVRLSTGQPMAHTHRKSLGWARPVRSRAWGAPGFSGGKGHRFRLSHSSDPGRAQVTGPLRPPCFEDLPPMGQPVLRAGPGMS